MLGFDGAIEVPESARFGQGSGRILFIGVSCLGTEDNLADCDYLKDEEHDNCSHAKDAGAVCYSGAHPNPFQVRLIGGANKAEGRVEVMHDGSWGTVCDFNWDLRDARMVCRKLGFDGALEAPTSARFGRGSGRILLISVICDGTEENLADCAHFGVGDYSQWGHAKDAGAICYSGAHPNPFQVRLIGGANKAEGRVEFMHDGSWRTVCDWNWDLRDASVVCRMLGFDRAVEALRSARFGQGSGLYGLIGVISCDGTECNLVDCAYPGIGRYSCSHAGAICYSGKSGSTVEIETKDSSLPSTTVEGLSKDASLCSNTFGPFSSDDHRNLFLSLGISIPVSSIILIVAFVYCLRGTRKRTAKTNLDTTVYMDLTNARSVDIQNLSSIYQDLSSPPKLPERLSAVVSSRDKKSQVSLAVSQNTTGEQVQSMGDNEQNSIHEYMEVNTLNLTPPTDTHADIDGYLLPNSTISKSESYSTLVTTSTNVTENDIRTTIITHNNIQDIDRQYMDMNIAYQRSASGLDGYLLPGVTSADDADQNCDGYLLPSVTPSESEVIPNIRVISTGLPYSDNGGSVKGTLQSNRQDWIYENMDIKSVYREPQ